MHFTCDADVIVFQPQVGALLNGDVTKVSNDHVSCLIHGIFKAAIFKPRKNGSVWEGSSLKTGDSLTLKVEKIKNMNGDISLRGLMVSL